ncbi:MarR family winged helix-turn-helix transcriptional regulator [Agromyces sp. SYSU T00194]|uniref:MarR family winged helix-turn-helix transcriptional regulator n=1 Tax=Agromyces chitinivorans TaxID=3158560 RepID=UPI00339A430B
MQKTIAEQGSDLRLAVFRLARRLRAQKADDGMSDGQFAVLAGLYLNGAHTLTELADRERVSAPSMNRTVNCLQDSGYVERSADPDDGRKTNIALTDAGTTVVSETVSKRDAWLAARVKELPKEDRAVLARAVELMEEIVTR